MKFKCIVSESNAIPVGAELIGTLSKGGLYIEVTERFVSPSNQIQIFDVGVGVPVTGTLWKWAGLGSEEEADLFLNAARPNAQIRKFKCTHSERDYVPVGTVVEGEYVGGDSVFKLSRNYFSISPAFRKGYNMPVNGQLFSWSSVFE